MGRRNVKIPAAGLPRAARGRGGAPEGRGQAQEARAGGQAATRGACSALRRDGLARERGVRGAGPEAEAARRSRAATPAPRRPTPPPLRARRSVPNPLRSCGRERRRWRWSRSRAAPPPAVPRSRAPETLLPAGVAGRRGASPRPAPVPPPLGLAFGPRGHGAPAPRRGRAGSPGGECDRSTRPCPSASLSAAPKARKVVRARAAGDLAELPRAAPLRARPARSSPGAAAFWFVAGSRRTVIGGTGGRGARSPEPRTLAGLLWVPLWVQEAGRHLPFCSRAWLRCKSLVAANSSFCCEGRFF